MNYATPNAMMPDPNVIGNFGNYGNASANPMAYGMPTSDSLSGWNGAPLPGNANYDPAMAGAGPAQPGAGGGIKSWLGNSQNLATVFQGISALTGAYLGFQQLKQAKEGLKFQKEAFRTNLANSTQTYNTSLEDRIRGRTSNYEGKENDVSAYLDKNKLRTGTGG